MSDPALHSHLLLGEERTTQGPPPPLTVLLGGWIEREREENHSGLSQSIGQPGHRPLSLKMQPGLEMRNRCLAQMVSHCSALHLLACLSPPKDMSITSEPHALLCLCLGPSKTGSQRILSTEPLRFLHPSSPACSPRATQNTQPRVCASMHTSPGLPCTIRCSTVLLSGPGLWPEEHLYFKNTHKKRFYCLYLSFQNWLKHHSLYEAHQSPFFLSLECTSTCSPKGISSRTYFR